MLLMEFCTIRGGNPVIISHNSNLTFKVAPTAVFSNLYHNLLIPTMLHWLIHIIPP